MALDIRSIIKTYVMGVEEVHALQDVSLSIQNNEYIAIMGPSGSGKSTMMNVIGCLDSPTSGDYWLNGQLVSSMNDRQLAHARNRDIGFVFQTFLLIPTLTAVENVMVPLEIMGAPRPAERARELVAAVGLTDRASHYPAQLSGGEQQRIAIARAFACRPPVLLADEPTGNLDPDLAVEIMRLFREINARGTTVLVATPDRDLIERMQRRTVILERGQVIAGGEPE